MADLLRRVPGRTNIRRCLRGAHLGRRKNPVTYFKNKLRFPLKPHIWRLLTRAVARLRRDHSNLCLIAITGDDAPKLHKAVEEAGADAVLIKGELVEGLLERLRALKTRADAG